MKHNQLSTRRLRQSSHESTPTTRAIIAAQLGANVVAHSSIVVSLPGHKIGFQKMPGTSPYDDPLDFSSTRAEQVFVSLPDVGLNDDSMSHKTVGEKLLASIDPDHDSNEIIALKQLTSKIYGVDNASVNYQKMVTTLDGVFTADELRDFIGYTYELSHEGKQDSEQYINDRMTALSGFRVEASFFKLAKACGFSIQEATRFQDSHGMDFMVDGVPFDLKSSEQTATHHVTKHQRNRSRFKVVAFVPPISAKDFHGRLVVPDEHIDSIIANTHFKRMVSDAIEQFKSVNKLSA